MPPGHGKPRRVEFRNSGRETATNDDNPADGFKLRLLHLSDLHERGSREGESWRRRRVLGPAWLDHLDAIQDSEPFDLVCFTGDAADMLRARGEFDEALRIRREEELPVFERLGATRDLLVCRNNIAVYYLNRNAPGDREQALEYLHLALADARRLRIPEVAIIEEWIERAGEQPHG